MIVKNEEDHIKRCLESVRDYVDEMIIVDTGSTDSTVSICKEFGATIFHAKLDRNFAKARNYSLSKANGNYILVLDADEYLDKEDAEKLCPCVEYMQSNHLLGMYLTRYDYFYTGGWAEGTILRLFANDKSIQYTGMVYESVKITKERLYINGAPTIKIHHLGFFKNAYEISNKRKFYKSIMLNRPGELQQNKICYWIAEDLFINSKIKDSIHLLNKYSRKDDCSKRIFQLLGKLYLVDGRFKESEIALRKVLKLAYREKQSIGFLHSQFYIKALNTLAELEYRQGHNELAKKYLSLILTIKDVAFAHTNLAYIYEQESSPLDAIKHYNQALLINSSLTEFTFQHECPYGKLSDTFLDFKGLRSNKNSSKNN